MTDPSKHLILFVDLVGSTEVAAELDPNAFAQTYVASFRWAAQCAHEFVNARHLFPQQDFSKVIDNLRTAGDEILSFTPFRNAKGLTEIEKQDLAGSAVAFAYATKLYWLASPYNVQRMLHHQFPRDLAAGIHIGPAAKVPTIGDETDIVSLHINVAKRIESEARKGRHFRILASRDVSEYFELWRDRHLENTSITQNQRAPLLYTRFRMREQASELKGLPISLHLHELEFDNTLEEELVALTKQFIETPNGKDSPAKGAKGATKNLAEIFLAGDGAPFKFPTGADAVVHRMPAIDAAQDYVDCWFRAVETLPIIFMEEPSQALSCYFVSCAMMNHKSVPAERKGKYRVSTERILEIFQKNLALFQ